MNEIELLKTFRETRSETAFAELVRRYAGLVYSVARRRLTDGGLAEDITQMVFIRLAKSPPNVPGSAELAAWLHRTTLNVAIDTWRTEVRRRAREETAAMETNPATTSAWNEISPQLDEALNQLNDADRQALLLRFFGQKAMREVGAVLGVSEDAAKMRVSRAVERLRQQLGVGAACSAAVLVELLAERSVEAAPVGMVARLTVLKLPVATAGAGGLAAALLRISKWKLAVSAAGLALTGLWLASNWHAWTVSAPVTGTAPPPILAASRTAGLPAPAAATPMVAVAVPAPAAPAVYMDFQVVDAETGAGLSHVKIHAAFFDLAGMMEAHDLYTDDNGEAVIPEPDDAAKNQGANFFVTREGHVPIAVGFGFGGEVHPARYTMKLALAQLTGGRIVDEAGRPVAGVKIKIKTPRIIMGRRENADFQTCSTTSDERGNWSFSWAPKNISTNFYQGDQAATLRFELTKPGYAATLPAVPVAGADLTGLTLVINRGYVVTGQITDAAHQPLMGAHIRELNEYGYRRQSTRTDLNGIFTLTGAAQYGATGTGTYENLSVQLDGYAAQTGRIQLLAPTNTINFTLLSGNVLRGRVVNEAGVPINHVMVQIDFDVAHQTSDPFGWHMQTEWDGLFEWDSAPATEVFYRFDAEGYESRISLPLPADNTHHEIVLKRAKTP